jgi:nitric oxide reductase activation protein
MNSRSRSHLFLVAAARLKQEHANPKVIEDLLAAAKQEASRRAEGRDHSIDEDRRIERQRTLFNMLPSCGATDRLKAAMLQRCYDLMWDGDAQACDALAEFLPSADVEKMFSAWDKDSAGSQANGGEFSAYYHREVK